MINTLGRKRFDALDGAIAISLTLLFLGACSGDSTAPTPSAAAIAVASGASQVATVATTLAYLLAGTQLNPRLRFEGRNPPPSEASITATLNELNMNPDTPVLQRYAKWVNGAEPRMQWPKGVAGSKLPTGTFFFPSGCRASYCVPYDTSGQP